MDSAAGSTSAAPAAARRLENAQLNKSLDEIIRDNRKARKTANTDKNKNKTRPQKQNLKASQGQKQNQGQQQKQKQGLSLNKSASVAKVQKQGRSNAQLPKTSNLRQPWERPVQLPRAPVPTEPLKISIRNERATSNRPVYMMDVDGDRPSGSHYRSDRNDRDAVGSRFEYRMGGRSATEPMQIDYQFSRRR